VNFHHPRFAARLDLPLPRPRSLTITVAQIHLDLILQQHYRHILDLELSLLPSKKKRFEDMKKKPVNSKLKNYPLLAICGKKLRILCLQLGKWTRLSISWNWSSASGKRAI